MKSSSVSARTTLFSTHSLTASLLRRGVLRQLAQLKHGQLLIIEDGERLVFEPHDFLPHDNPADAQQPTNASGLQKRA